MTVSNDVSWVEYQEGTELTIPYQFQTDEDITVYFVDANGEQTELVLDEDYTLTGAGVVTGGTCTLITPIPTASTCLIRREIVLAQTYDLSETGRRTTRAIESALDRVVMQAQDLDRDKLDASAYDEELADLAEQAVGEALASLTQLPAQAVQEITGTGTDTYSGTFFTGYPEFYIVSVDGVLQTPSTDYTINASTQEIVFESTVANPKKIVIRSLAYNPDQTASMVFLEDISDGPFDGSVDLSDDMDTAITLARASRLRRLVLPAGVIGVSRGFDNYGITIEGAPTYSHMNDETTDTIIRVLEGSTPFDYVFYPVLPETSYGRANLQRLVIDCAEIANHGVYYDWWVGGGSANISEVRVEDAVLDGMHLEGLGLSRVEFIRIERSGQHGLYLKQASQSDFFSIEVNDSGGANIYADICYQATFRNLLVSNGQALGLDLYTTAIFFDSCQDCTLDNAYIIITDREMNAIRFEACEAFPYYSVYAYNNHTYDPEIDPSFNAIVANGWGLQGYGINLVGDVSNLNWALIVTNEYYLSANISFGTSNCEYTLGGSSEPGNRGELVMWADTHLQMHNGRIVNSGIPVNPFQWPSKQVIFKKDVVANTTSYWVCQTGGEPGTWVAGPKNQV